MSKLTAVVVLASAALICGCATFTSSLRGELPYPAKHDEVVEMKFSHEGKYEILGPAEGKNVGFRFVPLFPLINSNLIPAIVQITPRVSEAYKQAMLVKNADFLTDIHIERSTTNILLIFCIDEVTVWGQAARLKAPQRR